MSHIAPPTLISIIPFLSGGKGHMYNYHLAVGRAARSIGWNHVAAVAPDDELTELPDGWKACLDNGILENPPEIKRLILLPIVKSIGKLSASISRFLKREMETRKGPGIVFLERFNAYQLLALLFSVVAVRGKDVSVWLLYRHPPTAYSDNYRRVFRILNKILKWLVGEGNFRLLTDSDPLKDSWSSFFRMPITVVPIPHAMANPLEPFPKNPDEIVCWWPGPPTPFKGWEIMKRLVSLTDEGANKIKVIVAESSKLTSTPGGTSVVFVKDALTPDEYHKWLSTADILLLPYDPEDYRERTSGIFVEGVVSGKTPLVSRGTWMAHELKKHDLEELIVDWGNNNIVSIILGIHSNKTIVHKIELMQQKYVQYHSETVYAAKIGALL